MNLAQRLLLLYRLLIRRRGLLARGLLCWIVGCLILVNDEVNSYDTRFHLRGDQRVADEIVLIKIRPSEASYFYRFRPNYLAPLKEVIDVSDTFFWESKTWVSLLHQILQEKPQKIGVTFYFPEALSTAKNSKEDLKILRDPRIFWATRSHQERPLHANASLSNVGLIDIPYEEDGVIRKLPSKASDLPHMAEALSGKDLMNQTRFINYRSSVGKYPTFSLSAVLSGDIPPQTFANKIVIIGPESTNNTQFLTPLGPADRPEILAQMTDTLLKDRIIHRFPNVIYSLGLFLLMGICLWIMTQYPQSVATAILIWIGLLSISASAWIFDTWYYWVPAVSTSAQIAVTWIVFIGHQANRIERKNWHLKQEQKYLQDLEQLKNNFVSLISHDLKTPIAKIDAIAERLRHKLRDTPMASDIQALEASSEELNKYIQSILKVLRVESKDFHINKEVCDINELAVEVINQLSPLAAEKNIVIEQNLEPMFSFEADPILLREVLLNLIDNAIKYTPLNGKVSIHSQEIQNKVTVEIKDTGEGIAPEELHFVWHKFVRGKDQSLKTKGSGLGLYLVKYFIELHGGEVFIESEKNKGTMVSFTLPIEN